MNNQRPKGHVHHPANVLTTDLDLQSNTASNVVNAHEKDIDTDYLDLQLTLVDDEEDPTKKIKKKEQKKRKIKKKTIRFFILTHYPFNFLFC